MFRAIGSIGLGAGLMYYLDAASGRRRRAMVRDRMVGVLHDTEDAIGKGSRDFGNRLSGAIAELRSRLAPNAPVPDDTLVARVRARMGRLVSHPHAIQVTADHGHVRLSGLILTPERPGLLAAVALVPGVSDVDDALESHDTADHIPALQGDNRPSGAMAGNWSPAVRVIAGLVGLQATGAGLRRGGLLGFVIGLTGAGLILRAITNRQLQRLIGLTPSPQGVTFQKSLTLPVPVGEAFDWFRNPENFPRFMAHLLEVKRLDERRHRWVARGPAGVPVEWESEITTLEPDRVVAWRSKPGSVVDTAGCVRFQGEDGQTRVAIRFSYHPPAGTVGHIVAALFGADAKHAMDEDLVRLKSLLSEGKTRVAGHAVTRDQVTAKAPDAGNG